MKKIMLFVACSSLLLSSCDTYTGSGAYAGATFGSILGSAIGGLSGGPRGSDMGTIIGMAGGAAVGAAIGSQADQKSQQQRESVYRDRSHHDHHSYQDGVYQQSSPVYSNDEIFDSTNSGDDRIYDFNDRDYTGSYSAQQPVATIPSSTLEELGQNYAYSKHLTLSRFPEVIENRLHLLGRERLASLFIPHLLQFIPERLATANPTHEMIHGRAWHTLGKVHQPQFLLRIRTVYKIFHNLNFLIICLSAPCSRKLQQPLKDSIR